MKGVGAVGGVTASTANEADPSLIRPLHRGAGREPALCLSLEVLGMIPENYRPGCIAMESVKCLEGMGRGD